MPSPDAQPNEPRSGVDAGGGQPIRIRYRIRFSKTGLLRWISHRDLARLWERLLRRSQLKLSMSEGFHPKPRIGFPSALALGQGGIDEVVELELAESLTAGELLTRLSADDQPGLQIRSVQRMPSGTGKAKLDRTEYVISTPDPELGAKEVDAQAVREAIDKLLGQTSVTVERKQKPLTVRVRDQILSLHFTDAIHLTLAASEGATLKPTDVLDLIGCSDWIETGSQIDRTGVILRSEIETTDPEFIAICNPSPHRGQPTEEVSK